MGVSQVAYRYALALEIAQLDWAALSWLVDQANSRCDVDRGDAYRILMMRKEVDVGLVQSG